METSGPPLLNFVGLEEACRPIRATADTGWRAYPFFRGRAVLPRTISLDGMRITD